MPRTRPKSPPRLTRDAERLIALANGLNASGSLTEDRFWESAMSALVAKLLENGNDAPIDGALDHLYQTNVGAYDTLIELVENESESLDCHAGRSRLAGAARGRAHRRVVQVRHSLGRHPARARPTSFACSSQAHVLAAGARVTVVPYLYSIDQLPRHFSELRRLTTKLADAAMSGESRAAGAHAASRDRAPARRHAIRRRLRRRAARARRSSGGRRTRRATPGRAGSLEQWIAQARPTISKLLPGCVYECLLPDAYYVNCRESDRRVRPFGIRAAVAFLENALKTKAAELGAVVAGFGEERVDEYRVSFMRTRRIGSRPRRRLAALRPRGRERAPRPAR